MLKKIKRVCSVIFKEGAYTFGYLVKSNLQEKKSEQWKYKKWRKGHETAPALSAGAAAPFFSIVRTGEDTRSLRRILAKEPGAYIAFVPEGVQLAENAQNRVENAAKICKKQPLLLYSDGDSLSAKEKRVQPVFKPEYSPDTLRSFFYMEGLLILKRELLERLEFSMEQPVSYGGYLLALEASFKEPVEGDWVCHIPEILYHRTDEKAIGKEEQKKLGEVKEKLFHHYGIDILTEPAADLPAMRVIYELTDKPLVSIIIPSKDNPGMLEVCLQSVARCTAYDNYEIVVIDNGSSPENRKAYETLCQRQKAPCRYYYEPMEFNFSAMCNLGAAKASGDFYLFLNDDIEIRQQVRDGYDWMERMLGQAMQPHTGAVGVKLLYPGTNRIQHVGVVNYESGAAHILSKMEDDRPLVQGRNRLDYNYSIVTGACLLVSRKKFTQIGGFEEELAVTFNDVEMCFRLLKCGYYNVVRNDVVLYHHESITRGEDAVDPVKFLRHLKEREKLFALHPEYVKQDAFYSGHLTQKSLDGSINIETMQRTMTVCEQAPAELVEDSENTLVCQIEYVRNGARLTVGGFAFDRTVRHNNWNRIYLVLRGEKQTLYVETKKKYNPTIAPQMESSQNLNFTEFYSCFTPEKLQEPQYQLGVAVKGFAGKIAKIRMSDRKLAL